MLSSRLSTSARPLQIRIGKMHATICFFRPFRGLHKHHIRGCGPLLLFLSLISYSKLASQHYPRFPSSYFWESYSKRISLSWACTIAHEYKYVGGVLANNGRIYFVSVFADSIGQIHLGNQEPAYKVAGGVDVTLGALLSPYFNKL